MKHRVGSGYQMECGCERTVKKQNFLVAGLKIVAILVVRRLKSN